MTDELDWRLLDRFLAGECSPPERAAVLQWLETHPLVAQYLVVRQRTPPPLEVLGYERMALEPLEDRRSLRGTAFASQEPVEQPPVQFIRHDLWDEEGGPSPL